MDKNFCFDIPFILNNLQTKVSGCGTSQAADAVSLREDFKTIKDFGFVARSFALVDILEKVKDHSLATQKVNVLPWEIYWNCQHFHESLVQLTSKDGALSKGSLSEQDFPFTFSQGKCVIEEAKVRVERNTTDASDDQNTGAEIIFKIDLDLKDEFWDATKIAAWRLVMRSQQKLRFLFSISVMQ